MLYQDKYNTDRLASALELSERLEADIAAGAISSGDRLPSIRDMAALTSLAPNTVAAAYRRLADRGVAVSHGRGGTFVLERPALGLQGSPSVPPGAVDLASGTPDRRLLPDLGRYVVHPGPSTSYIDPPILPELAEAGLAWLGSQGVEASRLLVTSGALDAIERVLTARLRPGDAVAVERPGWSAVTDLVAALGMRSVGVTTDDRGMVPDVLEQHLAALDAVVVTPRAQNPLGAAIDSRRRSELASILDTRPDLLIVEDDHAGPIAGAPLYPISPGRRRWAFVQSVAKALGPDLRLALVIGDDLTIDRVGGRFGVGPGWVSRILQRAVAAMMTDRAITTLMGDAEAEYARRRELLIGALSATGLAGAIGRSGLNVWVPVRSEQASLTAASAHGFVLRGGASFSGVDPAVRITVSNLDDHEIPRLAAAVADPGEAGRRLV
ncbi:MAG TPA: aminotransferase class I/II-fold pyridoxal phosphate-dependent enzyme [Acidimicrobiia bacterium]|nr:aminotransferase class I/II-fold pyridoxal phosphate-dependent enzyme [Acidimicrobiia bacterium]